MDKKAKRTILLSGFASTHKTTVIHQPDRPKDIRSESWASRESRSHSIDFGSPSNNRKKTVDHLAWRSLITRGLHGGISGMFAGGGVLEGISGLKNVVTSILHLFGSKKTPPPLSLFKLPDSQAQTIYVNHQNSSTQSQSPIYASTQQLSGLQYHHAEIAQAVKQALLTSSSLNDVVSEL